MALPRFNSASSSVQRYLPSTRRGGGNPLLLTQPTGTSSSLSQQNFNEAPWNGNLEGDLDKSRTSHKNTIADLLRQSSSNSQTLLDTTLGDLSAGRSDYQTGMSDLISRLTANLQGGRTGYQTKAQAGIDADRAARDSDFNLYQQAEQAGADAAISSGTRANKALFAKTGAGASSYADRLAAGLRLGAETRLNQNLANRRAMDRDAIRNAQAGLDSSLFNVERDDLGRIYGDEARLAETLAGQKRADQSFRYGAQGDIYNRDFNGNLQLENADFALDRGDGRFLYGERQRTAGRQYAPRAMRPNEPLYNLR